MKSKKKKLKQLTNSHIDRATEEATSHVGAGSE